MKLRMWLGGVVVAGALVCVTSQVFSQEKAPKADKPQMPPEMQEAMKQWAQLATPGEGHKKLDPLVGSWDTTTRMFGGGPDSPPMESKGTAEKTLGARQPLPPGRGQI